MTSHQRIPYNRPVYYPFIEFYISASLSYMVLSLWNHFHL